MEHNHIAHAFATLGHPGRLAVIRLLMRFAPRAVRPTEIAQALGLKPNTLSHHLSDLTDCGLVRVRRQGRSLLYSVDLDATGRLLAYLALDLGRARPDLLTQFPPPEDTTMSKTGFHVLFICSGNSARSIFAEALLRDLGNDRFVAHSAGTRAGTQPNPHALQVLDRNGHDITTLRSKHLSEFQTPDAPVMNFVFTVCDTSAAEECPPWPGQPITGHWGLPDPVKAQGTDAEKALVFAQTYAALRRRIEAFVALPVASLDRISLQSRVDQIDAREFSED
ncbi:metalloregulator ArsR/SmtB family transcription factor [Paracoccus sp. Ld10]|uniref:metalloregulator ArsR/SmtB family transcription factor n=1 Tax=Paracoccus sp. Ld10 TaxID=649158 RepID=UPI00386F2A15